MTDLPHDSTLKKQVYPGFAASEVLYDSDGAVRGVATRDVGLDRHGNPKSTFERGIELRARHTIFAEGCRGSCSEEIIEKFDLRSGKDVQTYGLGVKEVWEVPEEVARPGFVQHTLGWPLQSTALDKTFGGSFLYHMGPNYVLLGMVVGLDYENPYINPYREFQRWKMHPEVAKHLEGGTCVSYGARTLNEGGYHSIPKLTFPGGLLVGCSAGFLNSVKIKGTHTAIKSGMVAAESLHESLSANEQFAIANTEDCEIDPAEPVFEATSYATAMESSWAVAELKEVRNCHASFHFGFLPGLAYSGLSAHLLRGREPWTWKAGRPDAEKTQESADFSPIDYPPPDGVLSFDLLTNLQRSGVYHEDDQPSHLRVKEESAHVPVEESLRKYAGPEQRFCPAGVYEYVPDEEEQEDRGDDEAHALIEGKKKLVINAQNCVHCKCCSIKMPQEYIKWTVPEGGGGPQYPIM
uniref:Electron transfer flavoprotein-ubiquinone oxidoreductase n=1 Tax=Corethron hystrix TaxID=216773 RepID=A0A7S1BR38_9STRA